MIGLDGRRVAAKEVGDDRKAVTARSRNTSVARSKWKSSVRARESPGGMIHNNATRADVGGDQLGANGSPIVSLVERMANRAGRAKSIVSAAILDARERQHRFQTAFIGALGFHRVFPRT